MSERLTKEELISLREDFASKEPSLLWPSVARHLLRKLLAAAEECELLRAAIERHRSTIGERTLADEDMELYEVLK